ncbi:hypothetical protein [Nonomuraea lactucae]|uniref:hypothetical protein n=1 Tax=Nonomuraea lactucae TaxID=2249762 RepID=UPI000DE4556F|nr:hypothetical protein [Nonomuraea lactucae]
MADLDLFGAWGLWMDNVQVNQHTLYGFSILAMGRIGKVVSFFAGMTVVLDIIGPERIRQFGGRAKQFDPIHSLTFRKVAVGVGLVGALIGVAAGISGLADLGSAVENILSVVGVVVGGVALIATPQIARALAQGVARGLENEAWERVIRWSDGREVGRLGRLPHGEHPHRSNAHSRPL